MLKKAIHGTFLNMSLPIDREKTKKTIALVLDKIRTEADPSQLGEYRRLFKKEVSLFHRSDVAAYLLMLCEQGKKPHFTQRNGFSGAEKKGSRKRRDSRFEHENRSEQNSRLEMEENTQRYPLSEKESKRLFFSVGRSWRVYPREILGLINSKTAVPKEDIGAIRILDNYSFVQVRDTVAEKIIEALNGLNFRGRLLTVNYAKPRETNDTNETLVSQAKAPESFEDSEQDENHPEEENI